MLNEWGHVHGQIGYARFSPEVFGVDEIPLSNAVGIFVAESIERGMGAIARRLHFDRCDLVAIGYHKIHLVICS